MNASSTASNGTAKNKASKTPKPPKAPRVRAETLDITALIGQPYDIETVLASTPTNVLSYLAKQAATAQLSEFTRRIMKGSAKQPALSGDELKQAILAWTPSVKRRGKSPIAKISKVVASMSAEEKAELREMLAAGG